MRYAYITSTVKEAWAGCRWQGCFLAAAKELQFVLQDAETVRSLMDKDLTQSNTLVAGFTVEQGIHWDDQVWFDRNEIPEAGVESALHAVLDSKYPVGVMIRHYSNHKLLDGYVVTLNKDFYAVRIATNCPSAEGFMVASSWEYFYMGLGKRTLYGEVILGK